MSDIKRLLLLPHLKVHNANALSSPLTIGFPAMTAWLGAVHALQRRLNAIGFSTLKFNGTGIISHQCHLQTHKGIGDYVHSIIGTGNPLDKSGSRSPFIEDARCHLDISLVIEYTGIEKDEEPFLEDKISHLLNFNMKIAGGDIMAFETPSFHKIEQNNVQDLSSLVRQLMPGYALIERRDLMVEAMSAGQDAMDALIDHLVVHHQCKNEKIENEEVITWISKRRSKGWLVPIATGFHGLTDLGFAKNQRDPEIPHRFAESVVTLGEFKMPHSIKSVDEILWRYQIENANNLYLCAQTQNTEQTEEEIETSYYS